MKKSFKIIILLVLIAAMIGFFWFNKIHKKNILSADDQKSIQQVPFALNYFNFPQLNFVYVAQNNGYLKSERIDLRPMENNGSSIAVKLISSGDVLMGVVDTTTAMIAKSKGAPITIVAIIEKVNPVSIACHAEANVGQPLDLYGKKLTYSLTSAGYQQYIALAKKINLDRSKVTEMPVASPLAAFLDNQLDCIIGQSYNVNAEAQMRNIDITQLFMKDYGINFYSTALVANSDKLKQNPELTRKITRALVKGMAEAGASPAQAMDVFFNNFPDNLAKKDYFNALFNNYISIEKSVPEEISPWDGYIDRDTLQRQKDFLTGLGLIENDFSLDEFFSNDYLK